MKYTVILEKGESSHGAFVPYLPGCIAVGEDRAEALRLLKEAIAFHIEGWWPKACRCPSRIATSPKWKWRPRDGAGFRRRPRLPRIRFFSEPERRDPATV